MPNPKVEVIRDWPRDKCGRQVGETKLASVWHGAVLPAGLPVLCMRQTDGTVPLCSEHGGRDAS